MDHGVSPIGGTTSACAENTDAQSPDAAGLRNYLRVRGEYRTWGQLKKPPWELPPRARRIPLREIAGGEEAGTTSACAENTFEMVSAHLGARNYLRVRGEYVLDAIPALLARELPPRARRIRRMYENRTPWVGTTSACAENTSLYLAL